MAVTVETTPPRFACDACCGGLARWLRLLGVDTTYSPDIDDGELVEHALAEGRVLVSSDNGIFERRRLTRGEVRGILLPVGSTIEQQLDRVMAKVPVTPGTPRCTICNGALHAVGRTDVADRVPARTLAWLSEFHECSGCGKVFWEGTHWRRIHAVIRRLGTAREAEKAREVGLALAPRTRYNYRENTKYRGI